MLPEAGRVLDLGCGINAELARYRTKTREIWGADFEAHPQLQHPQWFRHLSADGAIPFADGHFDTVACVMVLEHVADPHRFLGEVQRVLRPGGHFVGHTINGLHYVTALRRLFGWLPHRWNQHLVHRVYGRPAVDTYPAHYRMNQQADLCRAARRRGFETLQFRAYADPGYFQFFRPLCNTAIVVDRILENVLPGCGRLYFTVRLRKAAAASEKLTTPMRLRKTA